MPSSNSEVRSRFTLLVLTALPLWACATAVDNVPTGSSTLAASGADGDPSEAGSGAGPAGGSASAGLSAGAATGAAGNGASGAPAQTGGAPGSSGGSAGKGGAGNGGIGSSGASSAGGAAKGGTSNAGANSGGASSTGGAGKGSGGTSAGGTSAGGTSAGGTSAGGTSAGGATGGTPCDAAHAVATLVTNQVYTGKANHCVRLAVNPSWSTIALQFQPMPGTGPYPVPFSYFSCGGNGTGSLTADYANTTFKSGTNPGCDFFVQFGGGGTTIKVTYYD